MERRTTRVRLVIRGRVQGVTFRESARALADRLGLAGWICNRGDGAVEAVFEGPEEPVRRMVEWCHRGPAAARVAHVESRAEVPTGERGFGVRHTRDSEGPR